MFAFEAAAIRPEDLEIGKTEYLIDDFLVSEAITMIYGAASQGKTWFMYAIAKLLAMREGTKRIFYVDMDNPKRQLVDRGVDRLLLVCKKVAYLSKSSSKVSPSELVASIEAEAYGRRFEGVVFIFDSTRDFVSDTRNDSQVKRFMERMKSIREAGATVLLIHHATKNGRVIDGSAEFVRSADNVYELKQRLRHGTKIHYALKVENDRDPIKDMAFCVDTQSYSLEVEDGAFVTIDPDEEAFVKRVLALLGTSVMGQGEILAAMGKRRDDKRARHLFEKYTGRFWDSRMEGRKKLYFAL